MFSAMTSPDLSRACPPECLELRRCVCHDRAFWAERAAATRAREQERAAVAHTREAQAARVRADVARDRAEAAHARAMEAAPPYEPVLLQRENQPWPGSLIIEGVGTTRGWDEQWVPFAAGLTALNGRTGWLARGRVPRLMERDLPVPVLWMHDPTLVVGSMFEARATADILYFRAAIVPPGTPGYDDQTVRMVWDQIRSDAAKGVSFAAARVNRDGSWKPKELSVCPMGANPCAVITRSLFPDGFDRERQEVPFDAALIRQATTKHQQAAVAQRSAAALTHDGMPVSKYLRVVRDQSGRMIGSEVFMAPGAEKANEPVKAAEPIADLVASAVDRAVDRAVEARIADIRVQTMSDWDQGIWKHGTQYSRGQLVTWEGQTYLAMIATRAQPGSVPESEWRKIASKGRDGRARR